MDNRILFFINSVDDVEPLNLVSTDFSRRRTVHDLWGTKQPRLFSAALDVVFFFRLL